VQRQPQLAQLLARALPIRARSQHVGGRRRSRLRSRPAYASFDGTLDADPAPQQLLSSPLGGLTQDAAGRAVRHVCSPRVTCGRRPAHRRPPGYAGFPAFDADARLRKWNLWGYIDARDGAQAVRKALEYERPGCDVFVIANADTVMSRPNSKLLAEVFPGVPVRDGVGAHDSLLSIDKARRLLGYEPAYSWRTEAVANPAGEQA
jgi:hypothetical protein